MASIVFVIPVFLAGTAWMHFLTQIAPPLQSDKGGSPLRFPSSLQEYKELATTMRLYFNVNRVYVIVLFCSAYLYKQTFAIPGTVFLNVLGGALFGCILGFFICNFLTAVGASCCYLLSASCGRGVVQKFFPNQLQNFRDMVRRNSEHRIHYLLFLRMFPMSPNWLINIISPLVGIPLSVFYMTVIIGAAPYTLLCTHAGSVILSTLSSVEDLFSMETFLRMTVLATVALAPAFASRRMRAS